MNLMASKSYDIEQITRLLLEMRDNCAKGEAYNDPKRREKYDAINAVIDLISNPSLLVERPMTGDLISREAALDEARDIWCRDCHCATTKRDCKACNVGDFMNRLRDLPAVDAVPVVRCKDCVFWMDRHVLLPDGTRRPYAPGEESVTADVGINCGARCMRAAEYLGGNGPFCKAGDFCSRGERKDDKEA